ncbi:alpha-soluble NSF attachment protein [Trichomonascus vanleenenianus]|uniref:alpha-soluble NSF attachment protein SEC17 n=1 Tax=Trichomonascus vanleenenianus TaxID=2268995 RepID=UPI003ECA09DC
MASRPEELIQEAEKLGAPRSKLMSFFSGGYGDRFDEAAEKCIQAANLYKVGKDYTAAGRAFEKAAAYREQSDMSDLAGPVYFDAYKAYKQTDIQDAARCLEKAISLETLRGWFSKAADYKMKLGELYEELDDLNRAIESYETAAEWYMQDPQRPSPFNSSKALVQVAKMAVANKDYRKAAENFDRVIQLSLEEEYRRRWTLHDNFLNSGLCRIAEQDLVSAERAVDGFIEMDSDFATTEECRLLQDVISCVKEGDTDQMSQKLFEYDRMKKLDKLKTSILLQIKDNIQNVDDDLL